MCKPAETAFGSRTRWFLIVHDIEKSKETELEGSLVGATPCEIAGSAVSLYHFILQGKPKQRLRLRYLTLSLHSAEEAKAAAEAPPAAVEVEEDLNEEDDEAEVEDALAEAPAEGAADQRPAADVPVSWEGNVLRAEGGCSFYKSGSQPRLQTSKNLNSKPGRSPIEGCFWLGNSLLR